jgi:hypothetical protein
MNLDDENMGSSSSSSYENSNSNSYSSQGTARGGPSYARASSNMMDTGMTQEEEDMLSDEKFQELYAGLPQVPADIGFGRIWRQFCAKIATETKWLSDAIWVARNGDKSDTCFALASKGYDPNRSDIQNAHSALQASRAFGASDEGKRAKTLRDMAGDIQWAASTALEAELQSLILEDNIDGDNGAGCGRILEVLLSTSGGRTLEHRSKITSLMVIIYASQIIMLHSAAQYTGGPKYIGDQVAKLLGRDVAAEYTELVTTDDNKRYVNVMYGWLFALIFDRDVRNVSIQDIIPFPTNMWAISYFALRFSSQHFYDYGHTLQYEMGRALKITNRAILSRDLARHFALHYRDGTPAGSYSKEEIVSLVAMFPDEPFPISEISMGQWMIELSDEIKINNAQLPIANAERLEYLKRVIESEDSFISNRIGKQVASADALNPNRPSIFNRGERVGEIPVGSSQDQDMFGPGGHISDQEENDREAEREAELIDVPSLKEKFRTISFLVHTEQVPPDKQGIPYHVELDFSKGRPSKASEIIYSPASSSSRQTNTSQKAVRRKNPPVVPNAPPYEGQKSSSSSSASSFSEDDDDLMGGRRYQKTRKIKRTRKTKKVMKKMKKSKKSRRSKK